ncbi:hypothetical protein DLAC_05085 [Tieghemostelium lacteum]|uniref:N-acetyltransferase domain-containing protein n=1 Tax=Tieghemostelium lacteum TaxID=361077 RepID=A0A151ZIF7_TIELA|nr:hypothetical protein DLAC_05085 [Tieghemostelium lacteum]|eukprot:KYQ93697.1 hypothetical protein DLAC_05085 [Tieghemostelium lacteum]
MTYELRQSTWEEFCKNTNDNYLEWGAPLTPEQYLQREIDTKEVVHGHRGWILTLDGQAVASCETYSNTSFYIRKSDKKLTEGISESVASVFVEPQFRGKGYATKMMILLNQKFQSEKRIFCDLYSDVDPKVYEKCGWHQFPAKSFYINETDYERLLQLKPSSTGLLRTTETITHQNYEPLLEHEKQKTIQMFNNIVQKEDTDSSIQYYFGKIFSKENFLWNTTNGKVYARYLNLPTPVNFGMLLKCNEGSMKSYVLWNHDLKDLQLNILKFFCKSQEEFLILIQSCIEEAKKFNMPQVTIWYDSHTTSYHFDPLWLEPLGLKITTRVKSSIPMVSSWVPLDPNSDQIVDTTKSGQWINIEKFNWV